ncbi:hypothetical protein SAMN05428936_11172 [Pelagibacterium halotolerans]|nr:hypothetical protein SAMN05428936_11172 [Pelagibacterium halotolerans]
MSARFTFNVKQPFPGPGERNKEQKNALAGPDAG